MSLCISKLVLNLCLSLQIQYNNDSAPVTLSYFSRYTFHLENNFIILYHYILRQKNLKKRQKTVVWKFTRYPHP